MKRLLIAALLCLLSSVNTDAKEVRVQADDVLAGWHRFCLVYASECEPGHGKNFIRLTRKNRIALASVNRQVNHTIRYVSDQRHWGVEERWDFPTDGKGDCEDFALEKRRWLLAMGFPRRALLLAYGYLYGKDGKPNPQFGHLILIARTDQGDFALDINTPFVVRSWNAPVRLTYRESADNPAEWIRYSPTKEKPNGGW